MRDVQVIAVLGAGDMGHGIAELAALKGFDIRLRDIDQGIVDKAMSKVRWSLDKLVQKKTVTKADANAAFARIRPVVDLAAAVADAGLVVEAVPEKIELKQKVFADVEKAAPPHTVLATNTSTMSIAHIGEGLKDSSRLVGMHFFNPVLLMDLVEVIPGPKTAPDAVRAVEAVSKRLGKTTVTLAKDSPGFVTSRLIGIWVAAACMAYEHRVASIETIDSAMKFKAGFPMGPFELADYTGLDIGFHASEYIASRLGPQYAAPRSIRERVEKGELGKKTGKGFYTWKDNRIVETVSKEAGKDFETLFILSIVANEAARLLDEGVASAADIDAAMRLGCAFPKGPIEWADATGLDRVRAALEGLERSTKHPLTRPAPALVKLVEASKEGT